jgi:hypothetical protein
MAAGANRMRGTGPDIWYLNTFGAESRLHVVDAHSKAHRSIRMDYTKPGPKSIQTKQSIMRRIILSMVVTLDGFFEGPNKEIDWHNVDADFVHYSYS